MATNLLIDPRKIEDKILEYLKRDKRGYRLPLLKILLDDKPKTIREIHNILNPMGIRTSALLGFAYRSLYPILIAHCTKKRYYYIINPSHLSLL